MPIVTLTVTENEVLKTLKLEEGHFVDLKAIEISPAKLTKALSAFANPDGGELFIGIEEDKGNNSRKWRGFAEAGSANGQRVGRGGLRPDGRGVRRRPLRQRP